MASHTGTVGCTVVSFNEGVADALDDQVGRFVSIDASESNGGVELASDNDSAIGVIVGKLQEGTGKREAVSVALIDAGGICRVRCGGVIARGAGVAVDASAEGVTAALGAADCVGIALTDSGADQELIDVVFSRQTPA